MTVSTDADNRAVEEVEGRFEDDAGSAVRCTNLTHRFKRQIGGRWRFWGTSSTRESVTALQDVTFAVDYGEMVGIAGPSGSGKSTLLHLLAGLAQPSAGEIELAGHELNLSSNAERTAIRHRNVGLVFQRFHLLPSLSARANVALPLIRTGIPTQERRKRASTMLEKVGLGDRMAHVPGQLSGGERQRVAIARALITDPDVVLADEPTGELDSDTGSQVLDLLSTVASDQAVIVASHDQAVHDVTDRVIQLQDGGIVADSL